MKQGGGLSLKLANWVSHDKFGCYDFRLVLTTRHMLKGVCAISLLFCFNQVDV